MLTVSKCTIYWRMRQFGLSKFIFTDISDEDLDAEVEKVVIEFLIVGKTLSSKFFCKTVNTELCSLLGRPKCYLT